MYLASLENSSIEEYFGDYGGCFVPDSLAEVLQGIAGEYQKIKANPAFQNDLYKYLRDYVGRPTPLYFAQRLTEKVGGARIYFKREDLCHTGAHKINNTVAQCLLAKYMGKKLVLAETGAGQHGVATATAASLLGLRCIVYMGIKDMHRQKLNVMRMRMLGAEVCPVDSGSQTLKEAASAAIAGYMSMLDEAYFVLGSAVGPYPYPAMVRDFQSIIGIEARKQILEQCGKLPDQIIACVGGGSNAIGLISAFLSDSSVAITCVEGGGEGPEFGKNATRFASGKPGVLHGAKTYVIQNNYGQIQDTHSIAPGMDYPGVGPQHAYLYETDRVQYTSALDKEALEAASVLAKYEGIIPAIESSHAIAHVIKCASKLPSDDVVIVNLSGRGDKDMELFAGDLN